MGTRVRPAVALCLCSCVLVLLALAPVTCALRTAVATAAFDSAPGSSRGDAARRVLLSLRPHVATVQFRGLKDTRGAVVSSAWSVAKAWAALGEFAPGFALFVPAAAEDSPVREAKEVTGVVYSTRMVVDKTGSWADPGDASVRHSWVHFEGEGSNEEGLTVVSVALSRSYDSALRQSKSLLATVNRHFGVPAFRDYTGQVIVGGALYAYTFSELTDGFTEAGLGGEIRPPSDQSNGVNTNSRRSARHHYILGNAAVYDMETPVFVVGDPKPYTYGLVFDTTTHKPLPPGVNAEDGGRLRALPVMRSFELGLKRQKVTSIAQARSGHGEEL